MKRTRTEGIVNEIRTERYRQIGVEARTPAGDDTYIENQIPRAAASYALTDILDGGWIRSNLWPWALEWWKPKDRRRDLVRAAALIVAEIERLDRVTDRQESK